MIRQPTNPTIRQPTNPTSRQPTNSATCKGQPAPSTTESRLPKRPETTTNPNTTNTHEELPHTDEREATITPKASQMDDRDNNSTNHKNRPEQNHQNAKEKRRPRIRKNKEITIATINVRGIKGKWRDLRRSTHLQIPGRNYRQQRKPNWPHSRDRKESKRCYWQYNWRNRKQRVQRNQNASPMADGWCHHHTHNDICMWRVDNQRERKQKTQCIFNGAIKTLLCLPKGTPTTILLNEAGNIPIEYTIKKTKILQAKCIDLLKEEALIKDATHTETSTWRKHIIDLAKELHVYEQMAILNKEALKTISKKK